MTKGCIKSRAILEINKAKIRRGHKDEFYLHKWEYWWSHPSIGAFIWNISSPRQGKRKMNLWMLALVLSRAKKRKFKKSYDEETGRHDEGLQIHIQFGNERDLESVSLAGYLPDRLPIFIFNLESPPPNTRKKARTHTCAQITISGIQRRILRVRRRAPKL